MHIETPERIADALQSDMGGIDPAIRYADKIAQHGHGEIAIAYQHVRAILRERRREIFEAAERGDFDLGAIPR